MNHWKDLLRLGENEENGFNKALVPEFAGGVAIGTVNDAETEKTYFIKTADLLSLQSFTDLAVRLINASGADARQNLPYTNGATLSFSRYGLGGEKVFFSYFILLLFIYHNNFLAYYFCERKRRFCFYHSCCYF